VSVDISEMSVYAQSGEDSLQTEVLDIVRLFSESQSRFVVEITPEQLGAFEQYMRTNGVEDMTYLGTVMHTSRFTVRAGGEDLINVSVEELQDAWKGGQA
jgi:phosphoribosylformylglycinamidine synthase subunit PurSL